MGQNLVLECLSKTLPISTFKLLPGETIVGRSSDCGVFVPDLTISRQHARIQVAGNISVTDLKSRNGTFVDEEAVGRRVVQPGQLLRFGAIRFRLTDGTGTRGADGVLSEFSTFESPNPNVAALTAPTIEALSPAQRRVFDLLLKGLPEKEVADRLHISQHTVHTHARHIYKIVGVHSRAELLSRVLPSVS